MKVLSLSQARHVLEVFEHWRWKSPRAPLMLAGWTVLAPYANTWMDWRSHVWITGPVASGKTTILYDLIAPLLGGSALIADGAITEAGLRHELEESSWPTQPVLIDDMENAARSRGLVNMAKLANFPGRQPHGMYCFASVRRPRELELGRITELRLRGPAGAPIRYREGGRQAVDLLDVFTVEMGENLLARTADWLHSGRFADTLEKCRDATICNLRMGRQVGTLLAGAWTLASDEPPADSDAAVAFLAEGMKGVTA